MLQKPKTKFGYARRIFALPVVFSVAFAYLVNAKNQEIKATNIEIAKVVSEIKKDDKIAIKKDTITPNSSKNEVVIGSRINKKSNDDKKIADLSKKIQEKTATLKNLKPESNEYNKNLEEIGKLSGEIGKIASSEEFLKRAMVIRMDGKDVNATEYFNSKEWKDKIKDIENMKIEIGEMPEIDFDFSDIPPPPPSPNAPGTPAAPRVKVYSYRDIQDRKWAPETDMAFRSAERAKESASTAKKRAKLDKERARLEEKRAKLEGERAKLEAERRALDGNKRVYIYGNNFSPMKFNKVRVMNNNARIVAGEGLKKYSGDMSNMKFYIDGKEVTKQDLDALEPGKIKNMNVNKRSTDGNSSGEIRIETKK